MFLLYFHAKLLHSFFRRKGERRNGAIPSPGGGSPTPGAMHHLGDSPAPARRSMRSGVTLSGSSVEADETGCTGGTAAVGQRRLSTVQVALQQEAKGGCQQSGMLKTVGRLTVKYAWGELRPKLG